MVFYSNLTNAYAAKKALICHVDITLNRIYCDSGVITSSIMKDVHKSILESRLRLLICLLS